VGSRLSQWHGSRKTGQNITVAEDVYLRGGHFSIENNTIKKQTANIDLMMAFGELAGRQQAGAR
jgi:hypothetical protein